MVEVAHRRQGRLQRHRVVPPAPRDDENLPGAQDRHVRGERRRERVGGGVDVERVDGALDGHRLRRGRGGREGGAGESWRCLVEQRDWWLSSGDAASSPQWVEKTRQQQPPTEERSSSAPCRSRLLGSGRRVRGTLRGDRARRACGPRSGRASRGRPLRAAGGGRVRRNPRRKAAVLL